MDDPGVTMRDKFSWYFFDHDDYEAAWNEGILTVDANVILDLYRYNQSTREALLTALESFKGRLWISNQTANEFIKNRRLVITETRNDFDKAKKPLVDLEKALSAAIHEIRSCRVIPRELSDSLDTKVREACKSIRDAIDQERDKAPDFEQEDEVVRRLEAALGDSIGKEPDNLKELLEEAERRKDEKIPPGYMDDGKDGTGFAGDFLMWREILSYGKESGRSMILVTSETKEDWWEKKSGRTLNPRLELLKEAYQETGNKILIYHTDRFLMLHQERTGGQSDETVLEEIREYSLAREPAVSVKQEVDSSDNTSNAGRLLISIARPVKNFTGTGRLEPNLLSPPDVTARLTEGPSGAPMVRIRANTGTTFNFNIHVHSNEQGKLLPVGDYLLEYQASCGEYGQDASDEAASE